MRAMQNDDDDDLRASEMSRGRCLRVVSEEEGDFDATPADPKPPPPRAPPTAPTPVSRDDAVTQVDEQRQKK